MRKESPKRGAPLATFGVADPDAETLILLHGTSGAAYLNILKSGFLKGPVYLTDCLKSAEYYARWKAIRANDESYILQVSVKASELHWDWDSYFDPIKPVKNANALHTDDDMKAWWSALDRMPEADRTFRESLRKVRATYTENSVPASSILSFHKKHQPLSLSLT